MISFGEVPASSVLPIFFDSYAGATGASITLTGLAITDVEIYKGTSMTQRSSDAGVVLIDTDGIDLDGVTGIHGFSIDLGDNTDAGFYAVGSFYNVVVSAVTIDSQTVNFVAATFRIRAAEHTAGYPVATIKDGTGTGEIDTTSGGVLVAAVAANAITATSIAADAITDAKVASDVTIASVTGAVGSVTGAVGSVTGAVGSVTGNVGGNVTGTVGSVVGAVGSVTGLTASDVGAIKTKTDFLPSATAGAAGGVFIAGTNAATTITTALTTTFTGNLVGTVSTLTTYTGNTPQTGDSFARIGVAGAGLTALGDARIGTIAADVYDWFWGKGGGVAAVEAAVWDAVLASHLTAGSTGFGLNAASSAGDPWGTALPGAYGAGTAGKIIGDNINATISSRMATYTQPTGFLTATFPGGTIANTTNITAGTITTTTNLTTNNDKTGYRLSTTGVDDIHDEVVEGSVTLRQSIRLANTANGAKNSGMGTTTASLRDLADSKDRIVATVDVDGNRSAVTLDLT